MVVEGVDDMELEIIIRLRQVVSGRVAREPRSKISGRYPLQPKVNPTQAPTVKDHLF